MTESNASDQHEQSVYDLVFLFAYLANVCLLTALSLLFRYHDFVTAAGGDDWHLGWIVGLGTSGAIIFRVVQGGAIDRFGPLWVWLLSLVGLIASLRWHAGISSVMGWEVYAARFLLNASVAGVFGSWLSFVTLRVEAHRVAEVLGVVGTSGFLGMAMGPMIGDAIFLADHHTAVQRMFDVATVLVAGSVLFALLAGYRNAGSPKLPRVERIGLWALLRQSHPGFLLVVAATMGMAISLPGNFLRPFAQTQGIHGLMVFFLTYNLVAFVARIVFRRASHTMGLRSMILVGLVLMAISMLLYLAVDTQLKLILPAVLAGLAHSFLFPSVMGAGASCFPSQYRGTAMSLMLAMYDVGVLIGAPLVALSLVSMRALNVPDYPLTFCLVCGLILVVSACFAVKYASGSNAAVIRRTPAREMDCESAGRPQIIG